VTPAQGRPASLAGNRPQAGALCLTMPADPPAAIPQTFTGTWLEAADVALARRLARRDAPFVRGLAWASEVGDQGPLFALAGATALAGLLMPNRRIARLGFEAFAAVLVASGIKTVLKRTISRTRPHVLLDEGRYEVRWFGPNEGPWQSFPSGHTAGPVAAACALARYDARLGQAALGATAVMGVVQVLRGAHYPADVIVGAAVGIASDQLVAGLVSRADRP
jgi:membrane-associated phospholipid phosphatase